MVMVMHNVIRYVIIQKQYKSWFIVTFYSLAVLLLFQNICEHIVQMMGTSMISTFVDNKKNEEDIEKNILFWDWLITFAYCMGNYNNEPILQAFQLCKPATESEYVNYYNFFLKAARLFFAVEYLYYIEVFIFISIGAALINQMGELSIQVSVSVKDLFEVKQYCS